MLEAYSVHLYEIGGLFFDPRYQHSLLYLIYTGVSCVRNSERKPRPPELSRDQTSPYHRDDVYARRNEGAQSRETLSGFCKNISFVPFLISMRQRSELLRLGFEYSNLIMEEAAQILEIETFLPMTLQQQKQQNSTSSVIDTNVGRLKRVVLIGDHHQLPPVIKNKHFQRYCKLDQRYLADRDHERFSKTILWYISYYLFSLFTRLVRLGVPYVELDAQGRSRPSISLLYSWRYKYDSF